MADADPFRADTVNRVIRRVMPFLFTCYVIAYLDRVNMGFAASELQRDLGLTDADYGFAAGLFFVGYCFLEIPSNLILERIGARTWIARIMVTWGLVSMGFTLVHGKSSLYFARVLLGVAEAGFFPGIILYLTYWIPARERARAGALFMGAGPVSVILGAPLSGALMMLDGALGLKGWQWLFLIEGFPAVVLGVVAWFYLTDRPEHATWLPDDERAWLSAEMNREREVVHAARAHAPTSELKALMSGKVWLLSLIYFLNALVNYGVFLWLPKILRDVSGFKGLMLSLVTAIPFMVSLRGMVIIGRHSDRTLERKWHAVSCSLTAAVGLTLVTVFRANPWLVVLSFTLSELGQRSGLSIFWTLPPLFLAGTAAAAGIALINSIGNLGGWIGPWIVGLLKTTAGDYSAGLLALVAAVLLQATLLASLRLPARQKPTATPIPDAAPVDARA